MEVVYRRCSGIDVHKENISLCVLLQCVSIVFLRRHSASRILPHRTAGRVRNLRR
jgi:hypothetical protein